MLDQWRKFIHVFKEEMIINGHTRIFGIIGNPVKHSLSPVMHNRAFNELGINAVYLPFCVANVEDAVKGIRALGIQGTSVTIPHKQSVMEFIDEIDPVAKKIGAVNTVITSYSIHYTKLYEREAEERRSRTLSTRRWTISYWT